MSNIERAEELEKEIERIQDELLELVANEDTPDNPDNLSSEIYWIYKKAEELEKIIEKIKGLEEFKKMRIQQIKEMIQREEAKNHG